MSVNLWNWKPWVRRAGPLITQYQLCVCVYLQVSVVSDLHLKSPKGSIDHKFQSVTSPSRFSFWNLIKKLFFTSLTVSISPLTYKLKLFFFFCCNTPWLRFCSLPWTKWCCHSGVFPSPGVAGICLYLCCLKDLLNLLLCASLFVLESDCKHIPVIDQMQWCNVCVWVMVVVFQFDAPNVTW